MLATTTTDMPLYIKIGGVNSSAICAHAEPHESVAVLLERIEEALAFVSMPYTNFTAAYSLLHGRTTGLREGDPDYTGIESGCPVTLNKFFTPAARLDPTKTVADYFGTHVEPGTASIVLEWPPEAHVLYAMEVEESRIQWAKRHRDRIHTLHVPSPQVWAHESVANAYVPRFPCASLWGSLSSCMPMASCLRWAISECTDPSAEKKKTN